MARDRQAAMLGEAVASRKRLGQLFESLGHLTRRNPTMIAGIAVVTVMALIALSAPLLTSNDPAYVDSFSRFTEPGSEFWFGTDNLGRDIYSRTIYGTRISLTVGLSVALITLLTAIVIGLPAGYYPKLDAVIMRSWTG